MTATLTAVGDSQSDYAGGFGVRPSLHWPGQLSTALASLGITPRVRAFGISGETTTGLLARADVLHYNEVPDVGIIYEGVNDPGNSIVQATTQANLQAVIKLLKYGAVGPSFAGGFTVADQTTLPATGKPGQRYVVMSDTSTTGGAAAWLSSHTATISGTLGGSPQSVWEFRYPQVGERGWGRVAVAATAPTKTQRIVVVSANYLNFTTGGDTPATPYATYAPVRAAQAATVAAENVLVSGVASVVFADLYTLMRSRIVAGTDPNFSADTSIVPTTAFSQALNWHYAQNNQHHNVYGDTLVVMAILAAFPAQWLADLAAL